MKTFLQQKPQVFFVIPSLKGGGAERVLIALANHFNQLNCTAVIIALNHGEPAYTIDEGVKVIYMLERRHSTLLHRIYYMLFTFFKLLNLLLREKPICALSFITSANIWTGIACSITQTPFIVSERTSPKRSVNQLSYLIKRLTALLYKRAAAVVVGAKGVEDCLRENKEFKNLNNVYKITNSVPSFNPVSPRRVHHRKFILGVGRLEYVKGFDLLITAFNNAKLHDVDLLIVGDGQERTNLLWQSYNGELKDRVIFTGAQTNLQDYYSQAELFVLPSRNEGYPNALVEAMSFGCPCIAVDCEFGPSEIIINEQNGLLVETGNIYAISNAITRLINDPLLKDSLGKQAMRINDTNNAQQIFKQWENLILKHVPQRYQPAALSL
ncbi:glycosyltransferase [Mucilaginibacter lappiensis]|uniref:glycosyltransferase n=1 Tax=Mucilaginibacter lappiensis TaxID=354630 RepID=UPI003D1F8B77